MSAELMVYALIAAGLVFWLRNILGTRSGDESFTPVAKLDLDGEGKIITLDFADENRDDERLATIEALCAEENGTNMAVETSAARDLLIEIAKANTSFNIKEFLRAAQDAFVYVVESFAEGDRKTLADLLSPQVYEAFDTAIAQREEAEQTMMAEIQSIQKASVVSARLEGKRAFVTVRFLAEEITCTKDRDQNIISGHPEKSITMRDVWTFFRDFKSKDPRWVVVETREDEIDDNDQIPNTH